MTSTSKPRTILVTGGTGYVGKALVAALAASNNTTLYYTYRTRPLVGLEKQGLKIELTDQADYDKHAEKLKTVDYIVHAAAAVNHLKVSPAQDFQDNIVANAEILQNLLQYCDHMRKFAFVSSCSAEIAAQDPSFYGLGKKYIEDSLEHLAETGDFQFTALRFPQLYGPGEPHNTFITKFIKAMRGNQSITLENDGAVVRDVLYIKDAVGSLMHALESEKRGVFTITDPATHTVHDIVKQLESIIKPESLEIQHVQVAEAEIAKKSFHFKSSAEAFGYKLRYTLEEGLRETINQRRETNHVS